MGGVVFSQQLFSAVINEQQLTNFMKRKDVKDAIKFDRLALGINFNDTKEVRENIIAKKALNLEDFDDKVWNMLFRIEQFTCRPILIENKIASLSEVGATGCKVIPTKVMQLLMDNGYINLDQIEIYAKKYQVNDDNTLRYLFSSMDFKRTNVPEKGEKKKQPSRIGFSSKESGGDGIFSITYNKAFFGVLLILVLSALHISPYAIF